MSGAMEANGQQESSALQDFFDQKEQKMMTLKISKLKAIAKKNGIEDEAVEKVMTTGADEDETKSLIIRLIFKNMCVKAAPTPMGKRIVEEDLDAQTCMRCVGCIRPPGHE